LETSVPTSPVKLQEQPFQALLTLLERPREVLTREELQKRPPIRLSTLIAGSTIFRNPKPRQCSGADGWLSLVG
jgi:hypothetical protein